MLVRGSRFLPFTCLVTCVLGLISLVCEKTKTLARATRGSTAQRSQESPEAKRKNSLRHQNATFTPRTILGPWPASALRGSNLLPDSRDRDEQQQAALGEFILFQTRGRGNRCRPDWRAGISAFSATQENPSMFINISHNNPKQILGFSCTTPSLAKSKRKNKTKKTILMFSCSVLSRVINQLIIPFTGLSRGI